MVDIYRSYDFDELEAARLQGDESASARHKAQTKDVKPEEVESAPADVTDGDSAA